MTEKDRVTRIACAVEFPSNFESYSASRDQEAYPNWIHSLTRELERDVSFYTLDIQLTHEGSIKQKLLDNNHLLEDRHLYYLIVEWRVNAREVIKESVHHLAEKERIILDSFESANIRCFYIQKYTFSSVYSYFPIRAILSQYEYAHSDATKSLSIRKDSNIKKSSFSLWMRRWDRAALNKLMMFTIWVAGIAIAILILFLR